MNKSNLRLTLLGSAFLIAFWMVFTWPLPGHVFSAIPASDRNVEKYHMRSMIPGDHLQLMYHFWLLNDMMFGKTPFYSNLYEFNTGDDAKLKKFDTYYMPFSIVYALSSHLGGRAFGWNLTGMISIFCTFFFTWLLTRRYTSSTLAAFAAAFIGTFMPYRWIPLLTGSPTGFAISMIPAVFLGIDIAIRDEKFKGGIITGLAIFFSYFSDLHVPYFSILAIPFWMIVAFSAKENAPAINGTSIKKITMAFLPVILFVVMAFLINHSINSGFKGTDLGGGGRTESEVRKYSPNILGFTSLSNLGVSNHIFVGAVAFAGLITCAVLLLIVMLKKKDYKRSEAVTFTILMLGVIGLIILSLGMNSPMDAAIFKLCRKFVPNFTMIRQPAKIFCMMPTFLAVAFALGFTFLLKLISRSVISNTIIIVFTLAVMTQWRCKLSPTICILKHDEPAYQAVAQDAEKQGRLPRVLVLPIWPGDSHWGSIYEYYVSLYHIRMLNGYNPVKSPWYIENVFKKLESANNGIITDDQFDALSKMGVDYVIFHEDAFPEQVSPFPSGFTLKRLLNHDRLQLLKQSDSIWAFKISPLKIKKEALCDSWQYYNTTRGWEMERTLASNGVKRTDADASGSYLVITDRTAEIFTGRLSKEADQRLILRARGKGSMLYVLNDASNVIADSSFTLDTNAWTWVDMPFNAVRDYFSFDINFIPQNGSIDLDQMFLAVGKNKDLAAGESIEIPAPCFYHAGYTDIKDHSVNLRKDSDPNFIVFYGFFRLLEKGQYRLSLDIGSNSPDGVELGIISIDHGTKSLGEKLLKKGIDSSYTFELRNNLPVRLNFKYTRKTDVKIKSVTLKRLQ